MSSQYETIRLVEQAAFPMPGTFSKLADKIVDVLLATSGLRSWAEVEYVDVTAGSMRLPAIMRAFGCPKILVNDIATRSTVTARGLFFGAPPALGEVLWVVDGPAPAPELPAAAIAAGWLPEPVCVVFDKLWCAAEMHGLDRNAYQYLALMWTARAKAADGCYYPLSEPRVLRPELSRMVENPRLVLRDLVRAYGNIRALPGTGQVEVCQGDMAEVLLAHRFSEGLSPVVAVNPPTDSEDGFHIANMVLDCLLERTPLPERVDYSDDVEAGKQFWHGKVTACLELVPAGGLYLVAGGDGVLSYDHCLAVWREYGQPLYVPITGRSAALQFALFRRS
jgi:hypothetical protein